MTRIIGTPALDHIDPFLLFDVFESDNPDDYLAGFPPHPHRGFETVTYMIARCGIGTTPVTKASSAQAACSG
jgi:redox-sensitive bicupin YhaK (pirin superfamily)